MSFINNPPTSTTSQLQLNQHVITSNFTITAGTGVVVPRYVEIAAGITLEIGADGDLDIT